MKKMLILELSKTSLNLIKKLFPETPSKEAYKTVKYDNSETRRVYINNDWKIKDSTGSTDFDKLVVINTVID